MNAYRQLVEKMVGYDAVSVSGMIKNLQETDAVAVLEGMKPALAAKILKNLQLNYAATLIENMNDVSVSKTFPLIDPQLLTAIMMHLSEAARQRLRPHIDEAVQTQVRELLEYPEGSIGRVVSTDFLSFDKKLTARDAIRKIRSLSKKRMAMSYAYVVDDDRHLIGVLNMRDLLVADAKQEIGAIMQENVFSLHCFTDIQDAANELSKRKYFAAPVVDSETRIVGIIKAERLIKGLQEDSVQGIQKMFGVSSEEKPFSTIAFSLRKRLLWLHVNLITAFMAAAVVALFENIIAKITILAVFLPVVAGQGGNAGAQSLAVVMRGLVMREIPPGKVKALILKEGGLGAINGLIIGIVTAVVAWLWNGNPFLGLVIGLGMFFNLIFAGLSGASIPLIMKKMGIDPAQSSSIILTTVTDVLGFFAFLGFALLFQDFLI
jgi:magnesium transporter